MTLDPKGLEAAQEALYRAWSSGDYDEAHSLAYAAVDAYLQEAADRLSAQSAAVAVKPLEWADIAWGQEADTAIGAYRIEHYAHVDGRCGLILPEHQDATFPHDFFGTATKCRDFAQADYEQRIRSALVDAPPASSAIPPGWKLVPGEATTEMLDAGVLDTKQDVSIFDVGETYAAMLAAAPPPPAQVTDEMVDRFALAYEDACIHRYDTVAIRFALKAALQPEQSK